MQVFISRFFINLYLDEMVPALIEKDKLDKESVERFMDKINDQQTYQKLVENHFSKL